MKHEPDLQGRIYVSCLRYVGDKEPEGYSCCGICHDEDKIEVCCHAREVVEEIAEEIKKSFGDCWNFKHEVQFQQDITLTPNDRIIFRVTVNDKGESSNMGINIVRGPQPAKPVPPVNHPVLRGFVYHTTLRGQLALFVDSIRRALANLTRFDWGEI